MLNTSCLLSYVKKFFYGTFISNNFTISALFQPIILNEVIVKRSQEVNSKLNGMILFPEIARNQNSSEIY